MSDEYLKIIKELLLKEASYNQIDLLKEALSYALDSEGKMLRPKLVLIGGNFNLDNKNLVKVALAIEILHIASLVHDDIIDNGTMRRNKPCLYKQFDLGSAILLGDYLLARAFELVEELPLLLRKEFSQLCKALCEGQFLEREFKNRQNYQQVDYFKMVSLKTGIMFESALVIGYLLENNNQQNLDSLRNYAKDFGIAFQIVDDLLDLSQTKAELGKDSLNDLKQGLKTLPILLANQKRSLLEGESFLAYLKETNAFLDAKTVALNYLTKAENYLLVFQNSLLDQELTKLNTKLKQKLNSLNLLEQSLVKPV